MIGLLLLTSTVLSLHPFFRRGKSQMAADENLGMGVNELLTIVESHLKESIPCEQSLCET
jgi:hypothetical protein